MPQTMFLLGKVKRDCFCWKHKLTSTQDGGYLNILNCITLFKVQNLSETYHVENIADGCKWYNLFSGFTLVGNTRLKCRKGVWSSSLPTCTGIFGKFPLYHLYQHHHNNPDHHHHDYNHLAMGKCDPNELPDIAHGEKKSHKPGVYR